MTPAPAGAPDRCPTCNSADPTVTLRGFSPGGSGGVDRCVDPWHSAVPDTRPALAALRDLFERARGPRAGDDLDASLDGERDDVEFMAAFVLAALSAPSVPAPLDEGPLRTLAYTWRNCGVGTVEDCGAQLTEALDALAAAPAPTRQEALDQVEYVREMARNGHLDRTGLGGIDAVRADDLISLAAPSAPGQDAEAVIEQAARILREREVEGPPWDSLNDAQRRVWLNKARALSSAGLLRGEPTPLADDLAWRLRQVADHLDGYGPAWYGDTIREAIGRVAAAPEPTVQEGDR